jgi:CelD/BcsL family acetyltransferase involved in cellulose biosynthesis
MASVLVSKPAESKQAVQSACESLYSFDPLADARWDVYLQRHPKASVFHSSPWLAALKSTYGYDIFCYTTNSRRQDLTDAIVFCRVNSWLTGRRLVSLPFSDHCEPLIGAEGESLLQEVLDQELRHKGQGYVEVRPLGELPVSNSRNYLTRIEYAFHQLDLSPAIGALFTNFHKNSIQRKIRKAESADLIYEEGRTEKLLNYFFTLFQRTRRRHRIPPPPRQWFRNLMRCFGDALKIRLVYKDNRPAAAMITLQYKDTLVYKYGASDPQFHRFGAMHLLYWRALQDAKALGLQRFDFGRTDADQHGLITFKNRWGATQSMLTYSRYSANGPSTHLFDLYTTKWKSDAAKLAVSCLPHSVVSKFGQMLYRHIA